MTKRFRKLTALLVAVIITGLLPLLVHAQTQVKGTVTDVSGKPLEGASIKVRGEKGGTTTKADGSFEISLKEGKSLEVSDVGYNSQTLKYAGGVVVVKLSQDNKSLSEIVVTGTGVATSRKKLGISVESISSDKLPQTPSASIDQALVGKIPGAQISSISGNPGEPVNILLRGINTINGGTQPLIFLDGVEMGATNLNSLDLANIDKVEVVQGAASASIYGAQGANGVIQLFSKRGKKGNAQINFSSSYSSNEFVNIGNVQKSKLHPYKTDASGNILNAGTNLPVVFDADGQLPKISYRFGNPAASRLAILDPRNINDQAYNANLKYNDHFAQVFQTGYTLNNSLTISGGAEKSDFSFSASNSTTLTPILQSGKLNRNNLSLGIGTEIVKGLKLRSNTQIIYSKNDIAPYLGGPGGIGFGLPNNAALSNIGVGTGLYGLLNTSPFFDLTYKQPDGNYSNYQRANFLSVNTSNPFYYQQYGQGLDNKIEVVQNLNLNYKINRFVELDAKYGINYKNENAKWTFANQTDNLSTSNNDTYISAYAPDAKGEIVNFQYTTTYQNILLSTTFKTDFEKDFHIKVPIKTSTLISYDYRKRIYKEYDTYGLGLSSTPPINLSTTSTQAVAYDYIEPFTTYGFLLDHKFEIGEWGGLTVGVRKDYSSNFGEGLSFTFPHINAYILPSSFNFWEKIKSTVPYFKIRSSYGEAGIQPSFGDRFPGINVGNVGSQSSYSLQSAVRNPLIKVETTKEFEYGFDFTVNTRKGKKWLSNITGSFTKWDRKSVDVIYNVSLPLSSGATSILTNAIDLSSKGTQFQLNLAVLNSKKFNWDFTFNIGNSESKIDKIKGEIAQTTAAAGSVSLKLVEGQTIGQIFGYKALTNVNQLRENKTPFIPIANQGDFEIVEGRVVNKNTKAIYFSDEAGFIGDPNPKFSASFINSIGYKDIVTLGFQFDWIYGSHLYNQTKEWMYRDGISGDFDKPVTINGVTAAYTAYHGSAYYALGNTPSGTGNNATKDYFYEDASFLRLRNISLAVDIAKLANLKVFKKLQLVLTGRNILTVTKYSGFDPEINSGPANSTFERGIDHSSLPNIKSYQIGLNVGF